MASPNTLPDTLPVDTIAQRELRHDNTEVVPRVEAGEAVNVTRNGVPVAELQPQQPGRQRVVPRQRLDELSQRLQPLERHRFRRDLDVVADP